MVICCHLENQLSMDKKKAKFLELLSQQINLGPDKFTFEALSSHLHEAVTTLPGGELKDCLLKDDERNAEKLWSLLKKPKKIFDEEPLFNTFNPESRKETLKNISEVTSPKKRLHHLVQFGLSHPSKNVFDLLLDAEQSQSANKSNLEILTKVTELCCRLTVGCNNSQVLIELMHFFLSEIGKIYEGITSSNQSLSKMKDLVAGFLTHCHTKYQKHGEKHANGNYSRRDIEYMDLLAAILSIYIDVLVMSSDRDAPVLDHLSNMVYILLRDSPSHILDTVNQISCLNDEDTVEFLVPFLCKVFTSTAKCATEFKCYLKYICAARKALRCLQQNKDSLSIRKVVDKVIPKEGLLNWISDKNDSLFDDLHLSGVSQNKMTEHFLQIKLHDDSVEESLLDLISEAHEEKKKEKNSAVVKHGETEQEEIEPNALFFVDSQGSSELLEGTQESALSNSKDSSLLQKQIDAMLEKLDRDSDDDEDDDFDYDINFNEETTLNETLDENTTKTVNASPELPELQELTENRPQPASPPSSPPAEVGEEQSPSLHEETADSTPVMPAVSQTPARAEQKNRKRKRELLDRRRKSTGSIAATVKDRSARRKAANTPKRTAK